MFNKYNTYDWSKLNDDIILKIFNYVNINCKVCNKKINNINIFLLKYNNSNNSNNSNNFNNSNKKFIFCSNECYNFI